MSTAAFAIPDAPPAIARLQQLDNLTSPTAQDSPAFAEMLANATPVAQADQPRIVPLASANDQMLIIPDIPLQPTDAQSPATAGNFDGFRLGDIFSQAAQSLERAQHAERAVADGEGSVLAMSVERAKANAMLSVAGAAAGKLSTALSTFVNMAV